MSAILKALQNRTVNVELKSEVVEFAIAGDLKSNGSKVAKIADKIVKESAKMEKMLQQYDKQRTILLTVTKESKSLENVLKSTIERAEKAAKELGVNVGNIENYGIAKDAISKLKNFSSYTYPAVK
tara:strand:- start:2 stop:379 length:378 start_codon:yes stop_codon:yes gene_type:complete